MKTEKEGVERNPANEINNIINDLFSFFVIKNERAQTQTKQTNANKNRRQKQSKQAKQEQKQNHRNTTRQNYHCINCASETFLNKYFNKKL
jgi:hypothetical protein